MNLNRFVPNLVGGLLATLSACLPTTVQAQPSLSWIRTGTTGYGCSGRAVAVDGNANVYAAGRFYGSVDFGTTNISASNFGNWNGFVAKYARNATVQWVRRLGTDNSAEARSLAVDAAGRSVVGG